MPARPITPHRARPPHMDHQPSPSSAGPSHTPVAAQTEDEDGGDENVFRDMTFEEVLEDLNARFLVNLPEQETSLVRVYWQAEQAHWFYEDYIRPLNPFLPSLSQRQFTHLIIESSPLYANSAIDYDAIWEEYCAYKKMVPCCGGIIISANEDKVLMVRGWKSNAGWCFPRGKINSEESDMDCAVREVEEETGYDMSGKVNEKDFIKTQISAQEVTMFLAKGVDESTVFETQTRKEIGAIEWIPFYDLPTWTNKKGPKRTGGKGQKKFYNVTPFVGPLKKWLAKNGINPYPPRPKEKQQHTNNIPGSAGKQGKERHLQPFSFDDTYAAAQQPATAIDHLFAKFIQKDEGVLALESDNARKLDQLFSNLDPKSAEQQAQERKEDDALASLLSGLSTVPASAPPPVVAAPPADPKQSKLLGILNAPKAASSTTPASPPRSTHQSNLLSMLASPPKPGAALHATPSPAATGSADNYDDRRSRQQALLEASFGSEFGAPQPNLSVPPRSHTHSAATSTGTYPTPNVAPIDMPSPQNYTNPGWHEPPQPPPQQPQFNQYSPETGYDGSPQRLGQYASPLQQPGQFVQPGYQQPPQQYLPPAPPNGAPAPSDHQRALLGTLFGAGGGAPRPQAGFPPLGAPFGAYPVGPQPGNFPPGGLPPGNLPPPGFGPGGFPNQYGARPSATGQYGAAPLPLQQQRVYSGGYAPPPPAVAYGGPGPQGNLPLLQQQQPLGPPPGLAPLPVPPAAQPISPSAVHQPVPRPPVGGGLLGLMGGR